VFGSSSRTYRASLVNAVRKLSLLAASTNVSVTRSENAGVMLAGMECINVCELLFVVLSGTTVRRVVTTKTLRSKTTSATELVFRVSDNDVLLVLFSVLNVGNSCECCRCWSARGIYVESPPLKPW
jgi:hypothetical protein